VKRQISKIARPDSDLYIYYLANQPVKILKRWNKDGIWHTFLGKTRDR